MGDNTPGIAEPVLDCIQNRNSTSWDESADIQYFCSDLPANDFNTLFNQLEDWKSTMVDGGGKFHPAAAPGSFYKRLFPPGSIHIVISTWALHYLAQVHRRKKSFPFSFSFSSLREKAHLALADALYHVLSLFYDARSFNDEFGCSSIFLILFL